MKSKYVNDKTLNICNPTPLPEKGRCSLIEGCPSIVAYVKHFSMHICCSMIYVDIP